MRSLLVRRLGLVQYGDAVELQERLVRELRVGGVPDTLLLLEHPRVITLGRGSTAKHLLCTTEELARREIELYESGRGGDITCHEPGQLVGYPILRLPEGRRDAHRYLRDLEQTLIDAVAELGIHAHREDGLTGIWVGREKLGAIGVRLSTGWITSHGFAVNVCNDLGGFAAIVPCGIRNRGVTTLSRLLDRPMSVARVETLVIRHLARTFGYTSVSTDRLAPARGFGLCSNVGGTIE